MADIYQEIWTADQETNGIEPILDTQEGNPDDGFVKVNSRLDHSHDPDLRVLTSVEIPTRKKATYDLCTKLFNNYSLAERDFEIDSPEERQELHDFVDAIVGTPPMQVARDYIAIRANSSISDQRWYNTVFEMWFRRFSGGGDPELTGFEHVIVGEQQSSKIQGYHYWWKYYLDDGLAHKIDDNEAFPGLNRDRIQYGGSRQDDGQKHFPESVTISFKWMAPDYDLEVVRPLNKPVGGFFVGCSVEGLMALGTVRAHLGANAPTEAIIEGAKYKLKLFHSLNNQHIRTFYPIFNGPAELSDANTPIANDYSGSQLLSNTIKIAGAKVNPAGKDTGFETITLVNPTAENLSLKGWYLKDKNGRKHSLESELINSGEFKQIVLSGQSLQLSNKGGNISLFNAEDQLSQRVSYSKTQAKTQGLTLLF